MSFSFQINFGATMFISKANGWWQLGAFSCCLLYCEASVSLRAAAIGRFLNPWAAWPSCWNLSLCVYYNILHFFCPFQNNKPLAILVVIIRPLSKHTCPTFLPLALLHTTHHTLKGNWATFFSQVLPKFLFDTFVLFQFAFRGKRECLVNSRWRCAISPKKCML